MRRYTLLLLPLVLLLGLAPQQMFGTSITDTSTTLQLNQPGKFIYHWDSYKNLCSGSVGYCGGRDGGAAAVVNGPAMVPGWSWKLLGYKSPQASGFVFVQTTTFTMYATLANLAFDPATNMVTATFAANCGWNNVQVTGTFTEDLANGHGWITVSSTPPAIPELSTLGMMGTGLFGILGSLYRKVRKK
jgi:hypothetical protein